MPKQSADSNVTSDDRPPSSYNACDDRPLPRYNACDDRPLPTALGAANANENPDEWVTGDAPMTGAQASLLLTLAEEAGEVFDGDLSKADASMQIEAWQKKAGRGHPKAILEEDQTDG
jgi:hypothetical protein